MPRNFTDIPTGIVVESNGRKQVFRWDDLEKVVIKKIGYSKFGAMSTPSKSFYLYFKDLGFDIPETHKDFRNVSQNLYKYLGIVNPYFEVRFDINNEYLLYQKI